MITNFVRETVTWAPYCPKRHPSRMSLRTIWNSGSEVVHNEMFAEENSQVKVHPNFNPDIVLHFTICSRNMGAFGVSPIVAETCRDRPMTTGLGNYWWDPERRSKKGILINGAFHKKILRIVVFFVWKATLRFHWVRRYLPYPASAAAIKHANLLIPLY